MSTWFVLFFSFLLNRKPEWPKRLTQTSDKNILGPISTRTHFVWLLLCHMATLYRPEKCAYCVFATQCCDCAQCRGSSLFQCLFVRLLCLSLFLSSCACTSMECDVHWIRILANIAFRLHIIKLIDSSRTHFSRKIPHFINESHKSWIFILIKWTSHFSTKKRAINARLLHTKQAHTFDSLWSISTECWIGI